MKNMFGYKDEIVKTTLEFLLDVDVSKLNKMGLAIRKILDEIGQDKNKALLYMKHEGFNMNNHNAIIRLHCKKILIKR